MVPGGESRQESVRNALAWVSSETVVIHDAARPLATPDLVRRVIAALDGWEGAIAAVPVDETLKLVRDATVEKTVDRVGLWHAQTPQAFRTDALRAAHERAGDVGGSVTDDAELIEANGGRVCVVSSSRANLKITYPEDFAVAEALLRRADS
ncbi:MAG: 2-C-methyl-D-erythritol 4-phosphate cytidylyltransferase [Actinomycetota bacterium]|jgi:2-C-methyl-D-erythritol 4-phosphate cytidylyltransferase|nr:2-C-methyl-D-erythritol 4-phosphate cytidylyltransferase [Actinomycetota bacterium]